jgi:hypothetical protein
LTRVESYHHEGWQISIFSTSPSGQAPFHVQMAATYGGKEHRAGKRFATLEAAKRYANDYATRHQKW